MTYLRGFVNNIPEQEFVPIRDLHRTSIDIYHKGSDWHWNGGPLIAVGVSTFNNLNELIDYNY